MEPVILSSFVDAAQFTGRDHSRVVVLLAVLALASVLLWVLVCLSIVVRQSSIIFLKILRYTRRRRTPRSAGGGNNDGS